MAQEFELLLKVLFSAIKMPISFFNADGVLECEFNYRRFVVPHKIRKDIILPLLLKKHSDVYFPEIHNGSFSESYFSMPIITNNKLKGTLIIGPFMQRRMFDEDIVQMLLDHDMDIKEKDDMAEFYKRLRLVTKSETEEIAIHIYYYFYHKILNIEDIVIDNNLIYDAGIIRKPAAVNEQLYTNENENYIITAVKDGESQIFEQLDLTFLRDVLGVSLTDSIEKVKATVKDFIIMLTDAIVREGIAQETSNDILKKFMEDLNLLNNINEAIKLIKNTIIDCAEKVAKMKNDVSSKTIRQCKQYIMNNPYSEITLKNLSELVDLNPSYLSRLFKVATGTTVTEYSKMEKIEEAKIMIETDSNTLSEISVLLGFYDYNHFVKVFKAITNTTPNQYKRYNTRRPARNI